MKRVISGRIYDTATATRICDVPSDSYDRGNHRWDETELYRSPRGVFFIAGRGGPMSRWAERREDGMYSGSGIRILTELEAREFAEAANLKLEAYEQAFGAPEIG